MNAADVRALLAYNRWANRQVLDDVRALEASQLTADLATSFKSVLGTIAHIFWAESVWLRRWRGESPKVPPPSHDAYSSLDGVERPWRDVQTGQETFAATLTDERLSERIAYENYRDERWEYSLARMIQHLLNHSSYHRGQVVTLLRQLGCAPRSTDLLVWIDEAGGTP